MQRYLVQTLATAGVVTTSAETARQAISLACAFLAIGESAYVYDDADDVLAECRHESAFRYVWTLSAPGSFWAAWHNLPAGHTLASESKVTAET